MSDGFDFWLIPINGVKVACCGCHERPAIINGDTCERCRGHIPTQAELDASGFKRRNVVRTRAA